MIQTIKEYLILVILILKVVPTLSQTITVDSFEKDLTDITASSKPMQDGNSDVCGLVKVMLIENGAVFKGNIVGDVLHNINHYWVYMSPGSKRLQINVEGFPSLDVDFTNHGINSIESGITYKLYVKCLKDNSSIIILNDNNLNGHEFVDLGLSVKWATCNIGANSEKEVGDYFAWGEIQAKEVYDYASYFDSRKLEPNEINQLFITYFNGGEEIISTYSGHDAARENWGSLWRIPTLSEFTELSTKCSWKLSTKKGIKGYTITGPNGKSIFLPAGGGYVYDRVTGVNSDGCYWTCELYHANDSYANGWYLNANKFYLKSHKSNYVTHWDRYYGANIRPVF